MRTIVTTGESAPEIIRRALSEVRQQRVGVVETVINDHERVPGLTRDVCAVAACVGDEWSLEHVAEKVVEALYGRP